MQQSQPKKGVKTAGKWAAKEADKGKDLAIKGVKLAKANPKVAAGIGTAAVAVPTAAIVGKKLIDKKNDKKNK